MNERLPVGSRVRLLGSHPHAGSRGFIVTYAPVPGLPFLGERPKVNLASGRECFVARDEEMEEVDGLGLRL